MTKEKSFGLVTLLIALGIVLLPSGCATPAEGSSAWNGEPMDPAFWESAPPSRPSGEESLSEPGKENSKQDSQGEDDMQESIQINSVTPGLHTLENFLRTALLPVGSTMYVWGGGWNEEDTGAGTEARSIGVSPRWREFAEEQDADYRYQDTRYQIHDGLDCSGFVGWAAYNVMETENGLEGYVLKSTDTAKTYAAYGWGAFLPAGSVRDWLPGDIASMNGHVWICLGTCSDGSVLLVHASPPGVRISGTQISGKDSEAVRLAEKLMADNYPEWHEKYPDCAVKENYLTDASQMRWGTDTFPDAEIIRAMTPEELMEELLPF